MHVTDKNFHVTLRKSKLFLEKLSATEGKVPNVLTAGGGDLHVTVGRANKYFSYSFFWEIPRRLNFMCRRFGILFSILLLTPPMKTDHSVPKRRHIKFRRLGITQTKEWYIQTTAKVFKLKINMVIGASFLNSYGRT